MRYHLQKLPPIWEEPILCIDDLILHIIKRTLQPLTPMMEQRQLVQLRKQLQRQERAAV